MRVVVDSNVWIVAFIARGLAHELIDRLVADHELMTSASILDEVERVLSGKLKMPVDGVSLALAFIRTHATSVPAVAISDSPCRDRDDAHVLGLLRSSEAGCAVTGDKDLLVLGAFEGRPIMSPRELFDLLAARP